MGVRAEEDHSLQLVVPPSRLLWVPIHFSQGRTHSKVAGSAVHRAVLKSPECVEYQEPIIKHRHTMLTETHALLLV